MVRSAICRGVWLPLSTPVEVSRVRARCGHGVDGFDSVQTAIRAQVAQYALHVSSGFPVGDLLDHFILIVARGQALPALGGILAGVISGYHQRGIAGEQARQL